MFCTIKTCLGGLSPPSNEQVSILIWNPFHLLHAHGGDKEKSCLTGTIVQLAQ